MIIERDVEVRTDDGNILRADGFRTNNGVQAMTLDPMGKAYPTRTAMLRQ